MRGKEIISSWQLTSIVIGFLIGTAVIFSFSQSYAGRDAWIAELLSAGWGGIILVMNGYIVAQYPQKDMGEIMEDLFNPLISRALFSLFFIYALLLAAIVLNEIQAFMVTMIMQQTPPWVFVVTFALTVGVIIKYGLEVFARCTEISIIIILLAISLMLAIGAQLIEVDHLKPFFTERPVALLKATIVNAFFPYIESGILLFIAVHVKDSAKVYKPYALGVLIATAILFLRPIYINGVFGAETSPDIIYPIFSLVRQATLGRFLERVELVMLVFWFLAVFIKLGACIFVIVKSLQGVFKIKDYKKLVLPTALLLAPLGINVYGSFQEPQIFFSASWPLINLFLLVMPLAVVFLACVYRKKILLPKGKKGG